MNFLWFPILIFINSKDSMITLSYLMKLLANIMDITIFMFLGISAISEFWVHWNTAFVIWTLIFISVYRVISGRATFDPLFIWSKLLFWWLRCGSKIRIVNHFQCIRWHFYWIWVVWTEFVTSISLSWLMEVFVVELHFLCANWLVFRMSLPLKICYALLSLLYFLLLLSRSGLTGCRPEVMILI